MSNDPQKADCTICRRNFTITHGGEADVKRHGDGEVHKKNVQQRNANASMSSFVTKQKESNTDKVTAAEVTSVYHNVQHGLSYRSGDCGTKLSPVMYPLPGEDAFAERTARFSFFVFMIYSIMFLL